MVASAGSPATGVATLKVAFVGAAVPCELEGLDEEPAGALPDLLATMLAQLLIIAERPSCSDCVGKRGVQSEV